MSSPVTAFIAVGANLGDRENTITAAIAKLRKSADVEVIGVSTLLENPAVGGPVNSPSYLNGAIEVRTTRSAEALLHLLLEIENELGRVRRERWAPRVVDLDLLLYGNAVLQTERLHLPHPRLAERLFVLRPLAEIAPDFCVPPAGQTVAQLLALLLAKTNQ